MPTYTVSNRNGHVGTPQPKDGDAVSKTVNGGKSKLTWGNCHLKGINMTSTEPQTVEGKKSDGTTRDVTLTVARNGDGFAIHVAPHKGYGQGGDELTGTWTATPPPPPYPPE